MTNRPPLIDLRREDNRRITAATFGCLTVLHDLSLAQRRLVLAELRRWDEAVPPAPPAERRPVARIGVAA